MEETSIPMMASTAFVVVAFWSTFWWFLSYETHCIFDAKWTKVLVDGLAAIATGLMAFHYMYSVNIAIVIFLYIAAVRSTIMASNNRSSKVIELWMSYALVLILTILAFVPG